MTPSGPNAPWNEHRTLAETIGQAVSEALGHAVGNHVDLGIGVSGDPEEMVAGRPLPMRAIVVRFRRPLRDVMIFLTSLKEDAVRPLVEAAAAATITAMDIPTSNDQHGTLGEFVVEEAVEYESVEVALEQLDALYLEATYSLELPTGELQMILGTGLLEAAAAFTQGVVDPFAEEAGFMPAGAKLELGDAIGIGEQERYELGDGAVVAQERPELAFDADGNAVRPSSVDELDAVLAAQDHADEQSAAASAAHAAETALANVAAAELPEFDDGGGSQRWTQLLSGVEVELSAELGRTNLALGDITSLAAESVLTLDQMVNEPVAVYVNGTRFATARLVVVDGEYGIEILEVVEQVAPFVPSLAA